MTALAESPAVIRSGPRRTPGAQFLLRGLPTLFMTVFLIYFLLPLAWLIIAATKDNQQLITTFGLAFDHFNFFSNFHQLVTLDGGEYVTWLRNTALYAVVSSGGAAMLCALAGYGFAKFHFRGKEALFWLVLGAVMVPQTALAIPTYLMFAKVNLTNGPFAVILPSLVSPFGIYLMRIYAEGAVPDTVLEAARSDGASEARIFFQISFRLMAPGFVTVLLFTFVQTWNNYFLPLVMLSNPNWYPVTQGLAIWNSQASAGGGAQLLFSVVITGALIAIIPLILAFLLLQRYWQTGLATGGVKG